MGSRKLISVPESQLQVESDTVIAVVGNGPVGVHFVNQLYNKGWRGRIKIFGEEEFQPYNRVLLSAFLNREVGYQEISNPLIEHADLVHEIRCKIIRIDTSEKRILDQYGNWHHFDELVLATGSRPHIPIIPGNELGGIYRFRDLRDAEKLYARKARTRHTIVIGGGLLGLETGKSMLRYSTQVTIVQHSPILMNRQLDAEASGRIQSFANDLGIEFYLNERVKEIKGQDKVTGVLLGSGKLLPCDTLIFATGIVPNIDLGRDAKLHVASGINIDSHLQTSKLHIYAIGECADYKGQVYGLVAPGLEQASILAANLNGSNEEYKGSTLITELKVLNLGVFSMGKVSDEYSSQVDASWQYRSRKNYRRIMLKGGRIVGALAIGSWQEIKTVQTAISNAKRIWPWQKWRFQRYGFLFAGHESTLHTMPANTVICNCQQVNLGQIQQALKNNPGFTGLQNQLGVARVCGTCKPLVQTLLNQPVELQPVKSGLLVNTFVALMVSSLLLLTPSLPVSQSVQTQSWDWLWIDALARQVSGFTILGFSALSLLLSLRKRLPGVSWLSFDIWRGAHVALAAAGLITLILHTGISFGSGINRWLILNFMVLVFIGIVSAVLSALEGRWVSTRLKSLKRVMVWGHIVAFWPLPVLITFHIGSVYYF